LSTVLKSVGDLVKRLMSGSIMPHTQKAYAESPCQTSAILDTASH